MIRSIPRPSAALVISCLALFVALGGSGYADVLRVPFNSVGVLQLRSNAVVSSKVRNHSLRAVDFAVGQLGVKGYEIVTARSDATSQTTSSLSIPCPTGKRVLGGGGGTAGAVVPGDGPYITVSQPFDGGGGWLIQTARTTAADSTLVGYAICAES
jgi:hypothetical protein